MTETWLTVCRKSNLLVKPAVNIGLQYSSLLLTAHRYFLQRISHKLPGDVFDVELSSECVSDGWGGHLFFVMTEPNEKSEYTAHDSQ